MIFVKDTRNKIDFFIRDHLRWGKSIPPDEPIHEQALHLQSEIEEFFKLFSWNNCLQKSARLCIGDIGTRTFAIAPVIEHFFKSYAEELVVHGFEIDAFRRFTNLRTRADYGRYYAAKVRDGHYHALDFTKWHGTLDIALMLHPFVTREPLLAWGLPLSEFKPEKIFESVVESLNGGLGLMLLSSPTKEEFAKAIALSLAVGFQVIEEREWFPSAAPVQKQPRFGALLKI